MDFGPIVSATWEAKEGGSLEFRNEKENSVGFC
jgi:hypothetical protein